MITFYISAQGIICLHFPNWPYLLANHKHACTHTHIQTIGAASAAAAETAWWRKSEGDYIDEAGGFLFSLLISLNLLIPIFKTCHVALLAPFVSCPKPDKTKLHSVAFHHRIQQSGISSAFTLSVGIVLISSLTLRVNLVTFNTPLHIVTRTHIAPTRPFSSHLL